MEIKAILLDLESNETHLIKDRSVSFVTAKGKISKEDLNADFKIVKTNKNKRFALLPTNFSDLKQNFKRGPQIMQDKDIGLIIAKTGINSSSVVVDAGAGTGALCLSLANIAKHVTTYDTNPEHLKVVKKNARLANIKNIEFKKGNIAKALDESNINLLTLDMPTPWEVFPKAIKSLKPGAWITIYLPNIIQMQTTLAELSTYKELHLVELTELIKRDWQSNKSKQVLRPEHTQVVHTGFLLFLRRL